MSSYEAPAKINLSLLVFPPRPDGYHPLESMVQTIEWCDILEVETGEEGSDTLDTDIEDNLVERALHELRAVGTVPPLSMRLTKQIPLAAGLGGGSSDAAAALLAGADLGGLDVDLRQVASRVGADVALFLTGGSLMMTGVGDQVDPLPPVQGFAVAVAVPELGISTPEAYRRWDDLEGPEGAPVPDARLPPPLRGGMPMRNDLLPAVLDLEPALGDFMSDLTAMWGTPVSLTGSGSGCFGYFATVDEAAAAAAAVSHLARVARGVGLRARGVARARSDPGDR